MTSLGKSASALLVLSYFALALALQDADGRYEPVSLVFTVAAFALLVAAARARLRATPAAAAGERLPHWLLPTALLGCLIVSLLKPPAQYLTDPRFTTVHNACVSLLAVLVAIEIALRLFRPPPGAPSGPASGPAPARLQSAIFYFGLACAFGLRLWLPHASPAPRIDVFVQFQESAQHLLLGENPYKTPVTDVYSSQVDYGYHVFGYAYLPTNLYFQTLAYALLRDIRYAYVFAEALAAFALHSLARRRRGPAFASFAVLLFLFHPRGLFSIEQAWSEPLIVGAYGLCDWLAAHRPGSRRLAVAYGILLSLKQYLFYFILHGLLLERRPRRLLLAGFAAFATTIPFLVADPRTFITYGVLFQLRTAFRPDGLTLLSAIHHWNGLTAGKMVALLTGAVTGGYTHFRYRPLGREGWRWATAITTFSLFLVGSQAFCNYYYFVGVMLLFVLAGWGEAGAARSAEPCR